MQKAIMTFVGSTALMVSLGALNAAAQQRVQAGVLTCRLGPSVGRIISARPRMRCQFVKVGRAHGELPWHGNKIRTEISTSLVGGVMRWAVLANTGVTGRGVLAGHYVGASGDDLTRCRNWCQRPDRRLSALNSSPTGFCRRTARDQSCCRRSRARTPIFRRLIFQAQFRRPAVSEAQRNNTAIPGPSRDQGTADSSVLRRKLVERVDLNSSSGNQDYQAEQSHRTAAGLDYAAAKSLSLKAEQ